MDNSNFVMLLEELETDVTNQTKGGYDAGDLITLQNLLIYDYSNVIDYNYLHDISVNECVTLQLAIKDMIRKISWSIYHDYYKDLNWLEELHSSIEKFM